MRGARPAGCSARPARPPVVYWSYSQIPTSSHNSPYINVFFEAIHVFKQCKFFLTLQCKIVWRRLA